MSDSPCRSEIEKLIQNLAFWQPPPYQKPNPSPGDEKMKPGAFIKSLPDEKRETLSQLRTRHVQHFRFWDK